MRRSSLMVILALICNIVTIQAIQAQNVVQKGNIFIEQTYVKTDSTFIDRDGNKFPIYKSTNGNLFVFKVSKKTGKKYKKYIKTKKAKNPGK